MAKKKKKSEQKHVFIHEVPSLLELIKSETCIQSQWQWKKEKDSLSADTKQTEKKKNPDITQCHSKGKE